MSRYVITSEDPASESVTLDVADDSVLVYASIEQAVDAAREEAAQLPRNKQLFVCKLTAVTRYAGKLA